MIEINDTEEEERVATQDVVMRKGKERMSNIF